MMHNSFQIRFGVLGGTMFSALFNIHLHDIIFTGVMASLGAIVSFVVSLIMKSVFSNYKNNK